MPDRSVSLAVARGIARGLPGRGAGAGRAAEPLPPTPSPSTRQITQRQAIQTENKALDSTKKEIQNLLDLLEDENKNQAFPLYNKKR